MRCVNVPVAVLSHIGGTVLAQLARTSFMRNAVSSEDTGGGKEVGRDKQKQGDVRGAHQRDCVGRELRGFRRCSIQAAVKDGKHKY